MKKLISAALVFMSIFSAFSVPKLAESELPAGPKTKERPSVCLVLAGGGAKGFAHLPVIEFIEQLGIPIDMVVGTSIGSIIGGMYCAGYSPKEICDSFDDVDWSPIFSDSSKSPYEAILGDHSSYKNLIGLQLGLDLTLKLGKGLSNGQNIYELIKEKLLKYPSNQDFNELPVPFRSVVCNMLTGEGMVLDEGDLAEAIRASMSLPTIFEPVKYDDYYFMDGGIRYNLPINVAKNMGYDIIIAVDISQKVRDDPEAFSSNPAVAALNTITIAQYTTTEAMYKDADLVIFPDIKGYGTLDFKKSQEIYQKGKEALEQYRKPLEEIKKRIFPDGTNHENTVPKVENSYFAKEYLTVNGFTVSGAVPRDEKFIRQMYRELIKGKKVSQETFDDFMSGITSTGNYKAARFRILEGESENILDVELTQTALKKANIFLNFDYESSFAERSTSMFNTNLEFQYRGLTGIGSIFALRTTAINDFGADFFYMQPVLGNYFLQTEVSYINNNFPDKPFFDGNDYSSEDMTKMNNFMASISSGYRTKRGNVYRTGLFYHYVEPSYLYNYYCFLERDGIDAFSLTGKTAGLFYNYEVDLQDRFTFARKGLYLNLDVDGIKPVTKEFNDDILLIKCDTNVAIPFGKVFSLSLSGTGNFDVLKRIEKSSEMLLAEGNDYFDRVYFPQITGPTNFGANKLTAAFNLQFEPRDQLTIMGGDLIFRLSGTAGTVFDEYSDINKVSYIYDIPINPILWSCSAGAAVLIRKSWSLYFRAGAASTFEKDVTPFFAFDIGSIRF